MVMLCYLPLYGSGYLLPQQVRGELVQKAFQSRIQPALQQCRDAQAVHVVRDGVMPTKQPSNVRESTVSPPLYLNIPTLPTLPTLLPSLLAVVRANSLLDPTASRRTLWQCLHCVGGVLESSHADQRGDGGVEGRGGGRAGARNRSRGKRECRGLKSSRSGKQR